MNFNGKVILVTGASSGIGAEIARHLASLGGRIALVGRNTERLSTVSLQITEKHGEKSALSIVADVMTDTELIITKTIEYFDQLDVLVNNAGVGGNDSVETFTETEFDRVFDTNVRGVIKLTQLAVPYLQLTHGNVVNISSVAGLRPIKNVLSYCISKAALDQFTRCTALDLAEKRIRVNSINPAVVKTPIFQTVGLSEERTEEVFEMFARRYPGKAEL